MSSLSGTWYNQIGEEMVVELDGSSMSGTYHNPFIPGKYPMSGWVDPKPKSPGGEVVQVLCYTLGFQNDRNNRHFVTAQCGQLVNVDGEDQIIIQWLVTFEALNVPAFFLGWGMAKEPWTFCTLKGQDVFTKTKPHGMPAIGSPYNPGPIKRFFGSILKVVAEIVLWFLAPPRPKLHLEGTWYSRQGEEINLEVEDHAVTGTYQNRHFPGVYKLVGHAVDRRGSDLSGGQVVSFCVLFADDRNNFHTVSSASGTLASVDGEEQIVMEWWETREAPDTSDAWTHFTLVGTSYYKRGKPSEEEVRINLKKSSCVRKAAD